MTRFTKKAGGETSSGGLVFVKPADLARAGFTGIVAEGEFVEAFPNKFNEEKHDFKIIADTPFKLAGVDNNGDRYEREVRKGDTLIVNGAGNLNYLMRSLTPGELCQISYAGKNEIVKGKFKGTLAHTFEVMYE